MNNNRLKKFLNNSPSSNSSNILIIKRLNNRDNQLKARLKINNNNIKPR